MLLDIVIFSFKLHTFKSKNYSNQIKYYQLLSLYLDQLILLLFLLHSHGNSNYFRKFRYYKLFLHFLLFLINYKQNTNQLNNIFQKHLFQMIKRIAILIITLAIAYSQSCLKPNGEVVKWWVVLKVPPKLGITSYAYYDSTMTNSKFSYFTQKIDQGQTPLVKTIQQINDLNLHHVAWNDQKPSGETSSQFAHSKGFIAYSQTTSKGFFISHSIPKYPAFVNNKIVPTIAPSQNVYGQDIVCFSLSLRQLQSIATSLLITWPFTYESVINNTPSTENLYKLSRSNYPKLDNLFNKHDLVSTAGYTIKTIHKNDKLNTSIFQDGLTEYLKTSPLIAQTWGRPIEKAWCGKGYQVLNVVNININGIKWNEQDDHSKWVVAGKSYACFGDMNRMSSQWRRGGSFYCLSESGLVQALTGIIQSHDSC